MNLQNTISSKFQGSENPEIVEKLLSIYTNGFLEIINSGSFSDSSKSTISDSVDVEVEKTKPSLKPRKKQRKNIGFDKLKNPILREELINCKTIPFNPSKHVKFHDLKYKSIYILDKLSRKKWLEYFKTSGVYLDKDVKSSRISQNILFDKSLVKIFDLKKSKPMNSVFDKLKKPILREKLERCKSIKYDSSKHVKLKGFNYSSIYDLDKLSGKKWNKYFTKGTVYLDKDVKSSRISESIVFDKSLVKIFGLKKVKLSVSKKKPTPKENQLTKRKYTKGGKNGKVNGFNFYVQSNDRMKPFQRRELLNKSEEYISRILDEESKNGLRVDSIDKKIQHLDSTLSDTELVQIWNSFYDEYGCRIPEFKEKWERENIGVIKDLGDKKDESTSYNPLRIDWFDNRTQVSSFG